MECTLDEDGALFERLRPKLLAISRRIVGSEAEAEDVVQDCYLKWHAAEQGALATPVAWLTTVVQHLSIDHLRRRARDAMAVVVAADLAPDAAVPLPENGLLLRAELGDALVSLMTCLSPAERLALVLREAFECEHADIAATLGTTAANARQHLARARRRLRRRADAREERSEIAPEEKMCRELVLRFQAAINGMDVAAAASLLAFELPMAVRAAWALSGSNWRCANDSNYALSRAA